MLQKDGDGLSHSGSEPQAGAASLLAMNSSCIPATATGSPATATAPRARLRTSCDACNAAKVKCSKEPTSCRRCERRGLLCRYGVSLRSRSAKQAVTPIANANAVTPTANANALTPAANANALTPTATATATSMSPVFDFDADAPVLLDDMFSVDALGDLVWRQTQQQHVQQNAQQHFHLPQHPASSPHLHQSLTCGCQQAVLSKLLDLSLASTCSLGLPFDRALSENRSATVVCKSALECSLCGRDDGVLLLLTLAALLAHVLAVLDRLLRSRTDALLRPEPKQQHQYQSLRASTPPPVRLSLGTYELDERDEQVLQTNLCKIELAKVSALVDAFSRRLSRLEVTHSAGANEAKLHHATVVYLKQALRNNAEALNRLAHASGCVDL